MLMISGPTCSGKTALAETICKMIPSEIISIDRGCFYSDVIIGNGKFTMDLRLPYHMVDILNANERMSVFDFLKRAIPLSSLIRERGNLPLACGGSMMYMERFLKGMDGPPFDDSSMHELERLMDDIGPLETHKMLGEMDPERALRTHPRDRRRMLRALSECMQNEGVSLPGIISTGRPWSGIFVDRPDEAIQSRIYLRTEEMLRRGWISEVKGLNTRGILRGAPVLEMTGVEHILRYLDGIIDHNDLYQILVRDNLRLVRKQRVWAKMLGFRSIVIDGDDIGSSAENAMEMIAALYE